MIDLSTEQLKIVISILNKFVPNSEVRLFGSRCKGTAKKFSDLDLVLIGDGPMNFRLLSDLNDAFEESDLPFRVDLLDWYAISPKFRQVIEDEYEVLKLKS